MKKFFAMLLSLGIGMLLMFAILTLVNIRVTQVDNTPTLDQVKTNTSISKKVLREVRSCVKPTGECYKDGQARTGKAVTSIGKVTILAAACAGNPDLINLSVPQRAARIQKCIVEQLGRNHAEH